MMGLSLRLAPLPTSPTRGEVPSGSRGSMVPGSTAVTLPLVGRAGAGAGR